MPKCPHCPRSFDSAHALKIHIGRAHKSAAASRGARTTGRRRGRPPGTGHRQAAASLSQASTTALLAELSRRAEAFDRLRNLAREM